MTSHSDKIEVGASFRLGYRFKPLEAFVDHGTEGTGKGLAIMPRPGNDGSRTATDHIEVIRAALAQLPGHRPGTRPIRKVPIRFNGARSTHAILEWLTGQRLSY